MVDVNDSVKLGSLPPIHDDRTLQLTSFMSSDRTEVPPAHDWSEAAEAGTWGNMLNSSIAMLNDCTVAAAGHMIQTWTANSSTEITVSDIDVLAAYKTLSGYDGTEATDIGVACLKALNHWRKNGIGGHRILSFAQIELKNDDLLKRAVYVFGGAYVGLQLPAIARFERYFKHSGVTFKMTPGGTSGPGRPGSWGHHCVCIVGFTDTELIFISWGRRLTMTIEFFRTYCDEAYVALSHDWLDNAKHAPNHIDLAKLREKMEQFTPVKQS